MKKQLFVVLAVLGLWVGSAQARFINIPHGPGEALASADYGGVEYSTSNYSAAFTTVAIQPCWAYGVTFSSGDVSAFVDVYSTGTYSWSGQGGASTSTIRVFNTTISSGGVNPSGSYSSAGFVPIGPFPVRFRNGCGFKPSTDDFTTILFHYWKEEYR